MQRFFYIVILSILIVSCKKSEKVEISTDTGKLVFRFSNYADNKPLLTDTMIYLNAAGNLYKISEVKYFISDLKLHKSDGSIKIINDWLDIYYVDNTLPSTMTWYVKDKIAEGNYDSISFTFGINKEKNLTGLFVNYPEINMAWPDILGGGYHYMMINGFWKDSLQKTQSLIFHLGIGQLYKGNSTNTDSIYAFVQNFFNVNLPNSKFNIQKNETKIIDIKMNIDKWFSTPHVFDFHIHGLNTMQNQIAMQIMKENGKNVFDIIIP